MIHIPKYPRKVNFGLSEKTCNLSCQKCMLHGEHPKAEEARKKLGKMTVEGFIKVLDEIKDGKPLLSPNYFSEPLLNKRLFVRFVEEARKRDMPVMINTNALLIDEWMAKFLIENLAIISISIDATTPETLLKTRSTDELEKIKNIVFSLLDLRGDNLKPRIVVSFTEEECNSHEKDDFFDFWITKVDAIRMNKAYDDNKQIVHIGKRPDRIPCRDIYDSMNVDFDGSIRTCCLDPYRETNLGNVFEDKVLDVWKGKRFSDLRRSHEDDSVSIDPFCENCDQWAGFNIVNEYEKDGLLVRETEYSTYYNRLDRMDNWTQETKRIEIGG